MPIIKIKNSTEKYKEISKYLIKTQKYLTHRNLLSGRNSNKQLTLNRIQFIKNNLSYLKHDFESMVDVGCGDGVFMETLISFGKNFTGILPTEEECKIVTKLMSRYSNILTKGKTTELPLKDDYADFILCNSVLHSVGFDFNKIKNSLKEFYRVLSDKGVLYIGEIPEIDEMKDREYGTSFISYCLWVLKNRGTLAMIKQIKDYLNSLIFNNLYTIQPPNMYFCSHNEFVDLLRSEGFNIEKIMNSETNEIITYNSPIKKGDLITFALSLQTLDIKLHAHMPLDIIPRQLFFPHIRGLFCLYYVLNILSNSLPFANSSTNLSRYLTCLVIGFSISSNLIPHIVPVIN